MKIYKTSRIVSILLIAAMLFTMTGVSAFAFDDEDSWGAVKESKNILVFGASTSSGYGLSDFVNSNCGFDVRNNDLTTWTHELAMPDPDNKDTWHGRLSELSYPWRLKQYIAEKDFGYDPDPEKQSDAENNTKLNKVTLNSMTLNGMRTNELRAMLDEKYYKMAVQKEKEKTWYYDTDDNGKKYIRYCGFLGEHIDSFVSDMTKGGATVTYNGVENTPLWKSEDQTNVNRDLDTTETRWGTYEGGPNYDRLHQYVTEEVAKADVIVIDVCMNNFGTYLAERVAGYAKTPGYEKQGGYYKQTIGDIDGVSDRTWSALKVLKEDLLNKTEFIQSETAKQFVDSFLFCYADCVTNFSACVDLIREINPNATIIAEGVYNTLDGVKLIIDGKEVDFGGLSAKGFDLVNAYIKGLDKNSPNYYYSDVSGGIETFMNQIVPSDADDVKDFMAADVENKSLMDNFYQSFNEDFMGGAGTLFAYPPATVYQQMLVNNFADKGITLTAWDDMADNDKITGTTYVTANGPSDAEENALTKQTLIDLACSQAGIEPAQFDTLPSESQQAIIEGAKGYYENTIVSQFKAGGVSPKSWDVLGTTEPITAITYVTMNTSADSIADAIKPMPSEDVEDVKYLTKENFTEFAENVIPNVYQLLYDAAKHTTIDLDRLFTSMGDMDSVNAEIQRFMMTGEQPSAETMELLHIVDRFMLYMGLGQHPSKLGAEAMSEDVLIAYKRAEEGGFTAFEEVFEKYYPYLLGIGLKIKEAYDKGDIDKMIKIYSKLDEISGLVEVIDESGLTADQLRDLLAMKDELADDITKVLEAFDLTADELKDLLHETANDEEKMAEIVKKVNMLKEVMEIIDEEELTPEQLKQLLETKDKLTKRFDEILDHYDLTLDDLEKAFNDDATLEEIDKYVEKLAQIKEAMDLLDEEGLTVDQLKEALQIKEDLEARINDTLDSLGLTMDDVIKAIDENITPEKLAEYIEKYKQISEILYLIDESGINADQIIELLDLKDQIWQRIQTAQEFINEKIKQYISDELLEQIKEIGNKLINATDAEDYEQILKDLAPILDRLKEIGLAVYNLPEYEEAMDAYVELLDQFAKEAVNMRDDIDTLKSQIKTYEKKLEEQDAKFAELTAKTIFVNMKTAVKFPKKTVQVVVSWDAEADATGYVLKVNGKEKAAVATAKGFQYKDNDVKVGKTTTYEVTPFVEYKGEKLYGRTYTKKVTPKVSLKKVTLKKVKAAKKALKIKWKKVAKANGYQVSYKVGKKTKYKNVKGAKKVTLNLKKLQGGKEYTVKVRAWKKVDGKKYYGKWSAAKKVTTKK